MKIVKIVNNNIVTSEDDMGQELIVMGRGLGFGKKAGQPIPDDKIEKVFHLDTPDQNNKLIDIIKDIPLDHIQAADKIILYAKKMLGDKLKDTIYLSLIDHISCAIERKKGNLLFQNPLLWEIKQYYPSEFHVGVQSLTILKNALGLEFPVDEAGFIALHFITSEYDTKMDVTFDIPKLIDEIVTIIENQFTIHVDKSSIHFERFITHLKFFAARVLQAKQIPDDGDFLFRSMIRDQYKESYQCALAIREHIEANYKIEISEEEVVYLTVHIKRITMQNSAE
ncbi:MAG: PRD domain-containing protein [Lachnospiraceae bacterium]|nr:PRD domain-containing protein [Lachnospiraceae bacterium]